MQGTVTSINKHLSGLKYKVRNEKTPEVKFVDEVINQYNTDGKLSAGEMNQLYGVGVSLFGTLLFLVIFGYKLMALPYALDTAFGTIGTIGSLSVMYFILKMAQVGDRQ